MVNKKEGHDMEKISLSVFFPCYNEEKNIEKLLSDILTFLPTVSSDYEVVAVDDGSSDRTVEIAQSFVKDHPEVRIIQHNGNIGYGAALRTGFYNCKKDYIFFTDGDNQFDITEMTRLLQFVNDFDIVTGYRMKRQDNFVRKINEFSFNRLIRVLFGLRIRDLNCAFKIYKKEVIHSITPKSNWGFINSEMLIRAKKKGFSIKEVGVTHYPRQHGSQTGASLKVVLGSLKEVFRLRTELKNEI